MKIKKADMKKMGLWSMQGHKSCIQCGKTDRPHNAKGLCKRCYYQTNAQHITQKTYREKLRMMAFKAYGGIVPSCACCGELEIKFLSIDHIDGCGLKKRKVERSGSPLYIYLKAQKYPKGYQILCHNCNGAKGFYGKCPHEETNWLKKITHPVGARPKGDESYFL